MTTGTVPERVAAGARWLDEHAPADWPDRVPTEELDMWDSYRCVCGWVFADKSDIAGYSWASRRLLRGHDPVSLGFLVSPRGNDYAALRAEWTRVILARRAAAEVTR